jgi:hypothetical protein
MANTPPPEGPASSSAAPNPEKPPKMSIEEFLTQPGVEDLTEPGTVTQIMGYPQPR